MSSSSSSSEDEYFVQRKQGIRRRKFIAISSSDDDTDDSDPSPVVCKATAKIGANYPDNSGEKRKSTRKADDVCYSLFV